MTVAVRYQSRSGNTKQVAEAIGKAVGAPAQPCDQPLEEPVDLLFLGGAAYGFNLDESLTAFVRTLEPEAVKQVAVFSTTAVKTSMYNEIKRLVEERGIPVLPREFHCKGRFGLLHMSRPSFVDLEAAAKFAQAVLEDVG